MQGFEPVSGLGCASSPGLHCHALQAVLSHSNLDLGHLPGASPTLWAQQSLIDCRVYMQGEALGRHTARLSNYGSWSRVRSQLLSWQFQAMGERAAVAVHIQPSCEATPDPRLAAADLGWVEAGAWGSWGKGWPLKP